MRVESEVALLSMWTFYLRCWGSFFAMFSQRKGNNTGELKKKIKLLREKGFQIKSVKLRLKGIF